MRKKEKMGEESREEGEAEKRRKESGEKGNGMKREERGKWREGR